MNNLILLTLSLLFTTHIFAAQQCESFFQTTTLESTTSNSYLIQNKTDTESSLLQLVPTDFSSNAKVSALEVIKLSLTSTSFSLLEKNYLNKDKITLGFSLKDGMTLEVSYASNSKYEDQFLIEQINIRSATGYKFKVAENVLQEHDFELKSDVFDLTKYLGGNSNLELKIPLVIRGQTLSQIADYAKSFELFTKDELRTLYTTKNEKQIARTIFSRKAKDLFYKVLVKEPFKLIIGGAMMFSVMQMTKNIDPVILPPVQIQQTAPTLQEKFQFTRKDNSVRNPIFEVKAESTTSKDQINYTIQRIE